MVGGGVGAGVALRSSPASASRRRSPGGPGTPAAGGGRRTSSTSAPHPGLVVGMVDDQGGVHVDVQRSAHGWWGGSGRQAAARAAARASRTFGRWAASIRRIDQPPHRRRGRLGPNTCSGRPHSCPTPSMQSAPSATAAARSANTAPGRRSTAPCRCPPDTAVTCVRQPGQHPPARAAAPSRRATPPRGHRQRLSPRHRRDILHLRSAFPLDDRTLEKSDYPLQDRHFRVSTPSYAGLPRKIRASLNSARRWGPAIAEPRKSLNCCCFGLWAGSIRPCRRGRRAFPVPRVFRVAGTGVC